MNTNKLGNYLFVFVVFCSGFIQAQTQTVTQNVPFSSGPQNMWGPSWDPVSINMDVTLFETGWNESFGFNAITNILGYDFGFAMNGNFSGTIGSKFSIHDFTTGEVEVDYPIDVDLTMNQDLTYDPGDNVTITTDYTLQSGASLETAYPNAGEATLDLYFEMGAGLSTTLCAFGCVTFPIIPSFNTGMQNVNILTVNENNISFFSLNGGTPAYSYNIFPLSTSIIPNDPLGEWGFEGILDMPHVYTQDGNDGTDLYACGGGEDPDSAYIKLSLNIFDLLGHLPAPVGPVLEYLDGSESIPLGVADATVEWTFFGAFLNLDFHNKQCFDFKPKVYGRFDFPVAVDYVAYDPGGTITSSGTSAIINVQIGGKIDYKYPCYFNEIEITPTYRIDGLFRNHTYDSVALHLDMSAISFSLSIPAIEITPEIHIPEICIPIPYPCPSWSCPWCWCTYTACTPAFTIPAVASPAINFDLTDIGLSDPVWEYSLPIADIEYDWYDNTWLLEGFQEYTKAKFKMIAKPQSISHTQTNVLCYGGNTGAANVTIVSTAYDVATPFTYSWTNGQTTEDISSLTAGDYELSVYDAHGCQLFTGVTITEPAQALSISSVVTDKSCNGGINNGAIDITVTGGTGGYSYAWSTGATSQDVSGLGVGTYSVAVTDANGCSVSSSFTINQPLVLGQTAAITNVNCNAGSNGAISVNTFGGVLPYSYSWSNGQTSEDLSTIGAGSYTLTLTDANSCVSSQTYVVTQPASPLSLTISGTDVSCKGGSNGAINLTTSGGTAPYAYQWSSSAGVVLPYTTEDLTGIVSGTYFVNVTDSKGCTAQSNQLINQPLQSLSSNPTLVNINCFGQATGSINPGIFGGTPGYIYSWSNGAATAVITNVIAGNYSLQVTDLNSCTSTFNYTLTQPAAPLNLALTGIDVKCFGENTGSIQSTVTGGTAPYSYLWSNGATSSNINSLVANNYSLTVTDSKGCTITASQLISQPAAPLALSSVISPVACYGNSTGSVNLTVTGGTLPYNYQWSNSSSLVLNTFTQDITGQSADSYTVLVTDGNSCQSTLISTITQPNAPISLSGIVNDVNCYALNDGGIDLTVTGGTSPYSYSWTNSAISQDLTSIVAGFYTVTVTDFNLCTSSATFNVLQPNAALTASLNPTDVLCNGDATGSVLSTVTGGTLPYSYTWSNGVTSPNLNLVVADVYTLSIVDAQGCTAFTGTVVNEPLPLVLTPTVTDASCFGGADGQIVLSVNGGEQPYYFSWGNQNEILLNNASETIANVPAANYFIRIKDKNNCILEQTITVGQPAMQTAVYSVVDVLCNGDSTGLVDVTYSGGTPPFTTVWNDGQTTEDAINLPAGYYYFLGTDAQGCEVRDTMVVEQPAQIDLTYELTPVSCIDQSDAAINISPYGGNAPYDYAWSNGQISQNASQLIPGFYTLIITDANACVQSFNFEIQINEEECLGVPNTITPNGDNYNDTWILENIELYSNAVVKIFNKWGNEIYSSSEVYVPWDGTDNGNPLPSEVYYYIIKLNNPENNQYTGTITIIR